MGGKRLADMTRQELYDAIWESPATKLAEELNLSDVAVAKRCKKLDIPQPPRGYWAKVAAGQSPQRTPLPPLPKTDAAIAATSLYESTPNVSVPTSNKDLHPVAVEVMQRLQNADRDADEQAFCDGQTVPRVRVTKNLIERAARAIHVIVEGVAARGIVFRRRRGNYGQACFEREHYQLFLSITEPILTKKRKVTEQDKRHPSWEWKTTTKEAAGQLTFSLFKEDNQRKSDLFRSWTESEDKSFESLLEEVIEGICSYFVDRDKQHEEWLEQRRIDEEKRKVEEQEEAKRAHEQALCEAADKRLADLLRAAEWHRLYSITEAFIDECERRWRASQPNGITAEQEGWLTWARKEAAAFSPFRIGYPDPQKDGAFDEGSIAFGGPYPENRNIYRPPTMPKIPPPENRQPTYVPYQVTDQYPFWLKHRR